MSGKRGSVLAMVLALGLGWGSAQAEGPGRLGKARKALSVKDIWTAAVGWWGGGGTEKVNLCRERDGTLQCTGLPLGQSPGGSQPQTEGGAFVDPNG